MKLEQAARQLLEIAEGIQHGTDWNNGTHAKIYRPKFPAAIAALREALAEQVEQEPVAWVDKERMQSIAWLKTAPEHGTKLYAAPVRTKDLTNSEKLYILGSHIDPITKDIMGLSLIDAVITAYKEKNK